MADLLAAMKILAVIAVAKGVTRAELMSMKQDRNEQFRSFAVVDFTDSIIRDVLISGIADTDIRREMLGTTGILEKSINQIISLVEGKEMARNALSSSSGSISSFKQQTGKPPEGPNAFQRSSSAHGPDCGKTFALFSEGRSG